MLTRRSVFAVSSGISCPAPWGKAPPPRYSRVQLQIYVGEAGCPRRPLCKTSAWRRPATEQSEGAYGGAPPARKRAPEASVAAEEDTRPRPKPRCQTDDAEKTARRCDVNPAR